MWLNFNLNINCEETFLDMSRDMVGCEAVGINSVNRLPAYRISGSVSSKRGRCRHWYSF